MKKTASLDGIFLGFYSLFMLTPYFFTNGLTAAMNNIIAIFGALYLLSKKYKPKSFEVILLIYYFFLTAISVFNHTEASGMHQITSYGKILIFLGVIDTMLEKRGEMVLVIISRVLGIYVLLDFLALLFFPNGLIQEARVFDMWSTAYDPIWVFGRKNNRIFYYMIEILLNGWRYTVRRNLHNKILSYVTVFVSLTAIVLEKSSTSLIVIVFVSVSMLIFLSKKERNLHINIKSFLFAYLLVAVAIVEGQTGLFQNIVVGIFKKTMTFSGRTIIWQQVLLLISQKPLFGWGDMGADAMSKLLGNVFFTSAHNQWLNLLLQGGIVLFSTCSILYISVFKKIEQQKDLRIQLLLTIIMFGLFVDMLFEAQFNSLPSNLLLMMIYLFAYKGNDIRVKNRLSYRSY